MPRAPRSEQFVSGEICVVHVTQRCVRRALLTGVDPVSGRDYSPRQEWIRRRLEILASVFGIDVLAYAVLSNHLHLIVRNRPDVVSTWSDEQVALRWLRVYPGRRLDEQLGHPTADDVQTLVRDSQRLSAVRSRLSDISWFMRSLCEPIARRANREDECSGHFWEGRFKAQRLTDESSLLACAMYVDLNPVRAALAATPEESRHTSAFDRIAALQGSQIDSAVGYQREPLSRAEASEQIRTTPVADRVSATATRQRPPESRRIRQDAWMSPLTLVEQAAAGPQPSSSGLRASDKGFLSLSTEDYLRLLDWTGRQNRPDKTGKIPDQLASILDRLGLESQLWSDLVWNFKRYFGGSAGSPASLQTDASRRNRAWSRGQRAVVAHFKKE